MVTRKKLLLLKLLLLRLLLLKLLLLKLHLLKLHLLKLHLLKLPSKLLAAGNTKKPAQAGFLLLVQQKLRSVPHPFARDW